MSISSVTPLRAVAGGRVVLHGHALSASNLPSVTVGGLPSRVVFASPSRIVLTVPPGLEPGLAPIRIGSLPGEAAFVSVGGEWATGLHQVDNPVVDESGNLFVTYSGPRGQASPVSIFRVTPAGTREPFATGIVNATSMAIGPDRRLYVSSRFEGAVYRVEADGRHEVVASDLGIACGLAFGADGALYVGDRSGTVFRVRDGRTEQVASLPASVAAFHLCVAPSGDLFVSGPTLAPYDHVHRIAPDGHVEALPAPFGRPQGLAVSPEDGTLYVVDALAGRSGVYRLPRLDAEPELAVAGEALIGLAFPPSGGMVVASNETVWRFH